MAKDPIATVLKDLLRTHAWIKSGWKIVTGYLFLNWDLSLKWWMIPPSYSELKIRSAFSIVSTCPPLRNHSFLRSLGTVCENQAVFPTNNFDTELLELMFWWFCYQLIIKIWEKWWELSVKTTAPPRFLNGRQTRTSSLCLHFEQYHLNRFQEIKNGNE